MGEMPSSENMSQKIRGHVFWTRFFIFAMVAGAAVGFFLLYPINEFVFYYEHHPDYPTVWRFIYSQLIRSLQGGTPNKTAFYTGIGAALGLIVALLFKSWTKKIRHIEKLHSELGKNLGSIIAQGEGPKLEFKSTFRWDVVNNKLNKALETPVLKTIAGFMNSSGGTLLIGVGDSGDIIGLERDYGTLKRKNRDGFEQAIMTAVATRMGSDKCQYVHILFHRIEEKDVCQVIVSPSPKPVFVKHNGGTKFYVRTGGSTRELNVEEAMSYISDTRK